MLHFPSVMISGHFDPFHDANLDYFKQALEMSLFLICVVSSDAQLIKKKGYVNIPEKGRVEIVKLILKGLGTDGRVVVNKYDEDTTIAQAIRILKPNILFRGYDKTLEDMPPNERQACEELGVQIKHAEPRQEERHGSNFR